MTDSLLQVVERIDGACGFAAFRPELSLDEQMDGCLRTIVVTALERAGGNQCVAAQALKVHRNTVLRYCDRLGIDPTAFVPRKKRVRADVRLVMRQIGVSA